MERVCEHEWRLCYYRQARTGRWMSTNDYFYCLKCKEIASKSYVTKSNKEV